MITNTYDYSTTSNTHRYENTCFHCGQTNIFILNNTDYLAWKITRKYVQDVFPHLTKEQRELLISGTHPKCWNEMFPTEDETQPETEQKVDHIFNTYLTQELYDMVQQFKTHGTN